MTHHFLLYCRKRIPKSTRTVPTAVPPRASPHSRAPPSPRASIQQIPYFSDASSRAVEGTSHPKPIPIHTATSNTTVAE